MTPFHRSAKRLIIVVVYLAILAMISTAAYFLFRTKPTCNDNRKNQKETEIDCGGPCRPCEVIPTAENLNVLEGVIIAGEGGKYDALAKITNPNSALGAANFDYSFDLLDAKGAIVAKSTGSNFILPGQTKYILAFNLSAETTPDRLDFNINSFEWSKFSEYKEPEISITSKEFNLSSGGDPGFAKLKAKIQNKSGYDFRKISAKAVIRNGNGSPIAVNETNSNDVRVNEEREINFVWNSPFLIDPMSAKIEIVPEVDVFGNENFMIQHGLPGQYESYDVNNQE